MSRYIDEVLPALLKTLSDTADDVVLQDLRVRSGSGGGGGNNSSSSSSSVAKGKASAHHTGYCNMSNTKVVVLLLPW